VHPGAHHNNQVQMPPVMKSTLAILQIPSKQDYQNTQRATQTYIDKHRQREMPQLYEHAVV
jgi:hypothetical protein